MWRLYNNRIDVIPTLHLLCLLGLQLFAYAAITSSAWLVTAGLAITPVCFFTVAITHNHFHVPMFRRPALNKIIELILFLQNGFTEGTWKPNHSLHHRFYLNQHAGPDQLDPNAWLNVIGEKISLVQYVPRFILGQWKTHPAMKCSRWKSGSSWMVRAIRLIVLGSLILHRLAAGVCIFLIPMLLSQGLTAIHSYYQHAGLDTHNPYEASFNYEYGPYFLYGIGYHTAHHLKPALHWSKLSSFHFQIRDRIPQQNFVRSYLSLPRRFAIRVSAGRSTMDEEVQQNLNDHFA